MYIYIYTYIYVYIYKFTNKAETVKTCRNRHLLHLYTYQIATSFANIISIFRRKSTLKIQKCYVLNVKWYKHFKTTQKTLEKTYSKSNCISNIYKARTITSINSIIITSFINYKRNIKLLRKICT